jgi:hypothetical protein
MKTRTRTHTKANSKAKAESKDQDKVEGKEEGEGLCKSKGEDIGLRFSLSSIDVSLKILDHFRFFILNSNLRFLIRIRSLVLYCSLVLA